jgi:dipeptidyl aminopeptidase/acylaminoacyl peptidase
MVGWSRAAAAASLVALLAALTATPAHATFPGRNGSLFVTARYAHGPGTNAVYLWRLHPRTGGMRARLLCNASLPQPERCELASAPAISPDGRRAAIVDMSGLVPTLDAKLRLIWIATGETELADLPAPFAFDLSGGGAGIRWLATGDRLSVELGVDIRTFELGLDGTLGRALLAPGSAQVDWAIDGRAAFVRDGNLHVQEPNGRVRRLTLRGAAEPSWSPHGRWIAFRRKAGAFVVPSAGGKARRIARAGAREPVWSPDGRKVVFLRRNSSVTEAPGATTFYLHDWRTRRTRRLTGPLAGESLILSSPQWQPLPRRPR